MLMESQECWVVYKTFLELHSKTELQLSPRQLKWLGPSNQILDLLSFNYGTADMGGFKLRVIQGF